MPMNEYLQENPRVIFIDVTFEVPAVDKALVDIRTCFKNEAAALFVVHDLNPRTYSARGEGFVRAQNWFHDDTNIRMR
jgi:peptide/nickel transport system substrate-binding protein